jgi:hypothetical protein
VVDLSPAMEPMPDAEHRACVDAAEDARAAHKAALSLSTPSDRAGLRWTSAAPSRVGLRRAAGLARQALARLGAALAAPERVRAVMRHAGADYDVELRLAAGAALAAPGSAFGAGAFQNLAAQLQRELLVGLCPARRLAEELRRVYGRYALFFPDEVKGDAIGVVWRPAAAGPFRLSVHGAAGAFPLQCAGALGDPAAPAPAGEVVPDAVGLLLGFRALGAGLVRAVEVCEGARVKPAA